MRLNRGPVSRRRRRARAGLATVVGLLFVAGATDADARQDRKMTRVDTQQQQLPMRMPPGFDEAVQPDVVRRDLQVIGGALDLDAIQKTIVEQLFLDYELMVQGGVEALNAEIREKAKGLLEQQAEAQRARHARYNQQMKALVAEVREQQKKRSKDPAEVQRVRDDFRRRVEALREELQQPDAMATAKLGQEFFTTIEQWREDKRALTAGFMDGIVAVLSDPQRARWPALERRLVRLNQLGLGRLGGESLDLTALLDEARLGAASRDAVTDILAEYELALHEGLLRRRDEIDAARRSLMTAIVNDSRAGIDAAVHRQIAAHESVRAINDRYLGLVAAAVAPDEAARLIQIARRRAHPRLFPHDGLQRDLDRALDEPALGEATRGVVARLRERYAADRRALDDEIARVQREVEPGLLRSAILRRWGYPHFGPGTEGERVETLVRRRSTLVEGVAAELEGAVPPSGGG